MYEMVSSKKAATLTTRYIELSRHIRNEENQKFEQKLHDKTVSMYLNGKQRITRTLVHKRVRFCVLGCHSELSY